MQQFLFKINQSIQDLSFGIPIPVSHTLMLKSLWLYVSVKKIFPLVEVNFKVLERRFKFIKQTIKFFHISIKNKEQYLKLSFL